MIFFSLSNSWSINGKRYNLFKSQIEILIWREVCLGLTQDRYTILKRPLGCNCDGVGALKSIEKQLKSQVLNEIKDIRDYFFLPKQFIEIDLGKKYLSDSVYKKPLICLIFTQNGPFGSSYHSVVVMITKKNIGILRHY